MSETFPQREERILDFWQREKIFETSLENRKGAPYFSFYDGPPFATGLPHYGHLLAGTIKDVVPRYKTMKGFYVPRRFGWDCHGLPVENAIEKAHELSGAPSIESFGVGKFNEECRKIVLRYTEEWERTVSRMGRWVDFSQTYKTMDASFMESVWWVFGQVYAKGLVYEGFKVMPFSAQLGTPISNFEANLNYKDVDDPSLAVTFAVVGDPETSFVAWTTTPWTLPSNLALMVGPELEYVKLKDLDSGRFYILGASRVPQYFKERFEIVKTYKGKELAGMRYEPLFPYFVTRKDRTAFRVILEESVGEEEGTGIVHAAPAFGELDFFACSREGIELVCPVDQNGKFTDEVPDYAGQFVKDADKEIIRRLKAEKKVLHHGQVRHRYPFCWRSDTPLIYKAVRTWFVAVEKLKDQMLAANDKIHWVPHHIKVGRFGKWLENARDWAISRNRYWGTPIPIWRNDDGDCIVIDSVQALESRTGKKITDLHRHFIDDLTFMHQGKEYRRIPEVFDCWFDSGSMPYAQNHYPFKKMDHLPVPADFIAEGLDQTRGWFYTLTVLSVALFDQPAFKNVVVNGIILAEDGNKMSKRLKNYPEPDIVINQFGADAVRLYLMNSPAVNGDDLRFSERGVELVLRQVLIPFWNAYIFLSTYTKIYGWKPKRKRAPETDIDRWILSLSQKLVLDVTTAMDRYELAQAVTPLVEFVDQLTNWYIRRSRSRFWSDVASKDRDQAFETLYEVLIVLCEVTAPFIPFLSDAIYRELRETIMPASVHLCDFPVYDAHVRDETLEREMALVQTVVSVGHSLRKENKLKVRQPLATAHVISADEEVYHALKKQKNLIADELNVKEVEFHSEEKKFVTLTPKPNFRILGKKVGKLMNGAQKEIQALTQIELHRIQTGHNLKITVEGEEILLTPEDVTVERQVLEGTIASTENGITVALDTKLNPELLKEGLSRELINKINTMRRDEGFAVSDRIAIVLQTTDRVKECYETYKTFIDHEVLAADVTFGTCEGSAWDLNGEPTTISIFLATAQ